MKKDIIRYIPWFVIILLMTSCSFPVTSTETTQPPENAVTAGYLTAEPSVEPSSETADSIEIVSIDPPMPAGISLADAITVVIDYTLTISEGTLQIWFERFTDSDCTVLGYNSSGGTTLAGTLEIAENGQHVVSASIPPLPLLEVTYVGVGARLWTPDNTTILVEDMSYDVCYAVNEPPEDLGVTTASTSPIPGATAGVGAITGYVYADTNGNATMDSGEYGGGPYAITLADIGCATTLATTSTDVNGSYAFFSLPPGTYCVIMPYASGAILPGYWQRVAVVANSTTSVFFGMQPVAGPPPPPTTGYCGDSVLNTGAGEQCDPPNLTDCTASCQTYTGYCGNGIVDPSLGEQCDPPNTTDCTASCQTYVGYCGNYIVDTNLGETCDPPNITDCTASCQIYVATCGDWYVDSAAGEQCDPPNVDYCTASCQLYLPNCGNYAIDLGEECDPPNTTDCTAQCQSWP